MLPFKVLMLRVRRMMTPTKKHCLKVLTVWLLHLSRMTKRAVLLVKITWKTPAALLEKLIEYEAVHKIRSWKDLKNRLEEDRRCYAFFHPRMPDEPLIFVEVARGGYQH